MAKLHPPHAHQKLSHAPSSYLKVQANLLLPSFVCLYLGRGYFVSLWLLLFSRVCVWLSVTVYVHMCAYSDIRDFPHSLIQGVSAEPRAPDLHCIP